MVRHWFWIKCYAYGDGTLMKYHNTDALIQSSINHFSQLPSGYFPLNAKEVLHYLDQSHRDERLKNHETAIVCVHGNPSWSWYFRHYFTPHQKLRVIAVDHLGMGFSSKVDRHVTIEEHANNLNKLLGRLGVVGRAAVCPAPIGYHACQLAGKVGLRN